jgi:hypothetical protein
VTEHPVAPSEDTCVRATLPSLPVRLDAFLAHVRQGHSDIRAGALARLCKRTVRRRRKSDPVFSAAYNKAAYARARLRQHKRGEHFREKFLALALEASDKGWLRTGKLSRKMQRLWYRWRGVWPNKDGTSREVVEAFSCAMFAHRTVADLPRSRRPPALPEPPDTEAYKKILKAAQGRRWEEIRKSGRAGKLF